MILYKSGTLFPKASSLQIPVHTSVYKNRQGVKQMRRGICRVRVLVGFEEAVEEDDGHLEAAQDGG
jgi:hypothetical protein